MFSIPAVKPFAALALSLMLTGLADAQSPPKPPSFQDVRSRSIEFIKYSKSITLTDEQMKTKREALSTIPAPCCDDNAILTCCCPCNLAKTAWGLANYAVARLGYDAPRTRALVVRWLQATNPQGYSGDACYRGGCSRPFAADGCGGMNEEDLIF